MNATCQGPFGARAGATLVEAVVALTLLGMVGLVGVELTRGAGDVVEISRASEAAMNAADDFLNAVSLWSRTELDQRLGEREQGPWRQEIQRPTNTLYIVTLRDSTGTDVVLRTSLFRNEVSRGVR